MRGLTALRILSVMALPASAMAADYVWDGSSTSAWNTPANWDLGSNYPGSSGSTDTASINAGNNNNPVVYSTGTATVNTIGIDAHAFSTTVKLQISGGSLTTGGNVSIKGRQSGAGSRTATLQFSSGTFAPNALLFDGREDASNGHAIADFDESFTVSADVSILQGYADIDVADTKTVTVSDDLLLSPGAFLALSGTGSAKFDVVDQVSIDADTGTPATNKLTLSSSELEAGSLMLKSGQTVNGDAEIQVNASALLDVVGSITLDGGDAAPNRVAILDFNESVSIGGDLSILGGYSEAYVSAGETFNVAGDLSLVTGGADFEFFGSNNTAKLDVADDVLMDAEAGGAAVVLAVASGELECDVLSIRSLQTAAGHATFSQASGAVLDPASIAFDGGNSSTRKAIANFADNVSVPVATGTGPVTFAAGFADIDVARGKTVTVGAITFNAGVTYSQTATGSSGNGVLSATSIYFGEGLYQLGANAEMVTR